MANDQCSMTYAMDNKKTQAMINEEVLQISVDTPPQAKPSSQNANHVSTQVKLLSLAKKFKLDGELVAKEARAALPERAREREVFDHILKQHNIEVIISKAMHYSSTDEITDRVDQDWFCHFIRLAENISNTTMQELWAKILVTEMTNAGSFSLKSLKAFHLMSVHEAKLLAKACSLAVTDRAKNHYRIISGSYHQPGIFNFFSKNRVQKVDLNNVGLSYSDIMMLADNHLLFLQEAESNSLSKNEEIAFNYHGKPLILSPKKNNCILSFYKFTQIGTELARLIADKSNEDYLNEMNNTVGILFNIKT